MDQRDDAVGRFRDLPKTADDFDATSADTLADDHSRPRDSVLRHVVRAIRDEPQPEGVLTAVLAALGLALDAAGGASRRRAAACRCELGREAGGGEFVLWIERIDPAGARARAAALAAAAARLAPFAGVAEPAFGVSVGVAPFDPARSETVMQLVLRAASDAARVKEQGGEPWPASLPA